MPTPAEQKALAFVAIVILLGGAVRVLRAGSSAPATTLEQQALARQASASDSAKQGKSAKRGKTPRPSTDTTARVVAGVASVPPSFARPDRPFDHSPYGSGSVRPGFSGPRPRIDTDANGSRPTTPTKPAASHRKALPDKPVDLDLATAQEIEMLPRIGPALARRIVANRDSLGPFGSLAALKRVKGMGPASLDRLAPLVTFGGRAASRGPGS
jgi:DNA uptake protein ComE-like DNA-binding protein